jgi:methylated-DNA-[protein]-cysteine S-methyltransferase
VGVSFSEKGVRKLNLPVSDKREAMTLLGAGRKMDINHGDVAELRSQVARYFTGGKRGFDCRLDLSGATPFQRRVWKAAREIPHGEVRSYSWVAGRVGNPAACRAVGNALAANPLPLIIPCHRVIRSNGKPGGFGGRAENIESKLMLLELEGCRLKT